ncbi:Hypothetical predicted protein, partial [Marmota monax]
LGPPPVISANASSAVENLDSVAAECHTNASHIEWYRNSVPISASQRIAISADGRTLVIRRVSRHDRTLQCVIQRYESFPDILQKSDTVSLTVAYGPDYVSLSTNLKGFDGALTAGIGSQVQLECSCDSDPSPKYHWLHNGSLLSSDANLNFFLVAWEQMGNYRCIGENLVTQLAFYGHVRIQPPRECRSPSQCPGPKLPPLNAPDPHIGARENPGDSGSCHLLSTCPVLATILPVCLSRNPGLESKTGKAAAPHPHIQLSVSRGEADRPREPRTGQEAGGVWGLRPRSHPGPALTITRSRSRQLRFPDSGPHLQCQDSPHTATLPAPPPPPGFSISGPLVVFLILVTSLGCGHLCGILVYGLVKLYLRRRNRAT